MGYDAYAVGVVGVRLEPGVIASKLHTEEKVRGCNHIMRDTAKFCFECGAEAFITVRKAIKEYTEDAGDLRLCGYHLIERHSEGYGNQEFIAYYWSECVAAGQTAMFPMNMLERLSTIRDDMQRKLELLGLWDDDAFGVHVFLYESC